MTLLPSDTSEEKAGDAVATAPARVCAQCGQAMAPDQDWCLSCGAAAPGRVGRRPGMRAAATVAALTLLLTGGAVAASYAALSDDPERETAIVAAPPPAPLAQTPAPPPAPPVVETTPPVAPEPAGTTADPPTSSGRAITPTETSVDTPAQTASSTPSDATGTSLDSSTNTTSSGLGQDTGSTSEDDEPEAEADPEPVELELPADAAALYDPYGRAIAKGDAADASDNSDDTAWNVDVKPEGADLGVGFVVDLGKSKGAQVVELATDTPGFRIELYAATGAELPPDVLDTRWAHVVDRSRVDETKREGNEAADGKERIVLGGGTAKYRYYLLWFTTPPDEGRTVRLQDFRILG